MSYTPGPWTIEEYGDDETPALVIHKDSETRVCVMATPGSHGDPKKIEADARLIAAAPEMLEALKAASDLFTSTDNIIDDEARYAMRKARVAIAKAEGRT